MPQLPNRELFEPVGNGGGEEGELEVVEKIRKTVATIGTSSDGGARRHTMATECSCKFWSLEFLFCILYVLSFFHSNLMVIFF